MVTCTQDNFDQFKDYIEIDATTGNVIGMWADYWEDGIAPTSPTDTPTTIHSSITYTGNKPELKVGGNAKKFTVTFYNGETIIAHKDGTWTYKIDGNDATSLLNITAVSENQNKIKFIGDSSYIGKILTIKYTSNTDTIVSSIDIAINSL